MFKKKLIKNLPDPIAVSEIPAAIEEKKALLRIYMPLIEALAKIVKKFTGDDTDDAIDSIVMGLKDVLDMEEYETGNFAIKAEARNEWPKFRPYLMWLRLITGRKGDAIIDLVVYIIDDLLDYEA